MQLMVLILSEYKERLTQHSLERTQKITYMELRKNTEDNVYGA